MVLKTSHPLGFIAEAFLWIEGQAAKISAPAHSIQTIVL